MRRLDPRARLLALAALAVLTAVLHTRVAAGCALALGLSLTAMARIRPRDALSRLLPVNAFIVFLWLVLPFSAPGRPIWSLGPLAATWEGLELALLITLKANAMLLAFLALAGTMPAPQLGHALARLGAPRRLCLLLLFTYRHLHVLAQEYQRLRTAARVRAFTPKTNLHTYRTFAYLAAMVLVRGFDRAQRVRQAMLLRGFAGKFPHPPDSSMGRADVLFLAATALSLALLAALEWAPGALA